VGKVFSKGHGKKSGNQEYLVGTLAHWATQDTQINNIQNLFPLMSGQRILPLGKIKSKRNGEEWRDMETLSQRLKEGWGKVESSILTSSSNFIKDDSFTYTQMGQRLIYVLCWDIYRCTVSSVGRIPKLLPRPSSSKTMLLQYTRGRLSKVFVEMKNVMINLITDSDGDLWIDIGMGWKDEICCLKTE